MGQGKWHRNSLPENKISCPSLSSPVKPGAEACKSFNQAEISGFAEAEWHPRAVVGMSSFLAYLLPDPEHSTAARTILVLGYAVAALCWLRSYRRARQESADSFGRWWLLGAVLLFLLAINKLFNLKVQFEAGIRALARAENWYDQRQPVQFVVAVLLPSVLAVLTGAFLATKARIFVRRHPLALAGWVLLLLYLALRQAQECKPALRWLSAMRYYDWRMALEVAGLLVVILAAFISHPPQPPRRSPPPAR
jgi:hypothetical protein